MIFCLLQRRPRLLEKRHAESRATVGPRPAFRVCGSRCVGRCGRRGHRRRALGQESDRELDSVLPVDGLDTGHIMETAGNR